MSGSPIPADAPFFVVLNSGSGRHDADTTEQAIAGAFDAAGRRHTMFRVDDPSRIGEVADRAATAAQQDAGIVVAVGGDGTLNAVAQAALDGGVPFGAIPQGTFNYFGRAHGISSDPAEAAQALLRARPVPVQVGLLNGRVFLVNASLGLYPQSLEDREEQKHKLGRHRVVAAWSALVTIARGFRPMRIRLESAGTARELRTLTLFVGNNRLQLEQIGLDAGVLEAGRLEAVVLRPVSTLRLLGLMAQGAMGKLGQASGIERFSFTRLVVTPARRAHGRMKVATDGEVAYMDTPLEFSVASRPLQLMLAPDAVGESAAP